MPCDAGGRLIDPALDAALSRFAVQRQVLVASDYDGTLSPIVADPAAATPHTSTLKAFLELSHVDGVTTAIVSGRTPEHLEEFVGTNENVHLVGNHGATMDSGHDADRVRQLARQLTDLLDTHPGAAVEPKATGAAFHYRHSTDPDAASAAARSVVRAAGASMIEGKMVVEGVLGSGDKGTALRALRDETHAAAVLFIGDDVTDEAAFGVLTPPDVSIKVGDGDTSAMYRVPDVPDVGAVFRRLHELLADGF